MNVNVTPLPGIGVQQDFGTRGGRRLGVITHRDGHSELLVFRRDDPDAVIVAVPLTAEESGTLASLLGAPHLVEHIAAQHREMTGIETHQLVVVPNSPYDGRTLGDTEMRTRTGASIVAILRGGVVHPSPRPDFAITAGDLIVVVGTTDGLAEAARIIDNG